MLATLEFLVASGFNPTVTSLHCGHSYLTASGNVSEHSTGTAVDIAAVNGIPILGNQGKGSITDLVIQRLLTLQGTMKPHQIISLMKFEDADNTLVDGRPRRPHPRRLPAAVRHELEAGQAAQRGPQAEQWTRLIERLGEIDNPTVPRRPVQGGAQGQAVAQGPVTEDRRFRFVQWEFAGRLGPPPGRYVVRRYAGDDVREVVVVTEGVRAAPARPRREPPGTVPVTRVTVIDADRCRRRRRRGLAAQRAEATLAHFLVAPTASPPPTRRAGRRAARVRRARRLPAPATRSPRANGPTRASSRRPSRRSRRAAPSTARPSGSRR